MMDELYNKRILQLAAHIPAIGHLPAPQAKADAVSRLCGSKVHVELSLDADGRVCDFAHIVEACALGQAASAIMAREIIGSTAEELHNVAHTMHAMLKEGGGPPQNVPHDESGGEWSALEVLQSVRDYPTRHASTLLTFTAVEDCLQQLGF